MTVKNKHFLFACALCFGVFWAGSSFADSNETYGAKIGKKAGYGFANMVTSWLEIPKSIINTTNDVNLAWGLVGGTLKGALNMTGRTVSGLVDVITFPIPTKTLPNPRVVWDDFDQNTTWGDVFRLEEDSSHASRSPDY